MMLSDIKDHVTKAALFNDQINMFTNSAVVTVANTVTATSIISPFKGNANIPANFLQQGMVIRILAKGVLSETGTPNITVAATIGSTSIGTTGAQALPASIPANSPWALELDITKVATSNTTSNVLATGYIMLNTAAAGSAPYVFPISIATAASIDLTTDETIDIKWTWGTASASNTMTVQSCYGIFVQL